MTLTIYCPVQRKYLNNKRFTNFYIKVNLYQRQVSRTRAFVALSYLIKINTRIRTFIRYLSWLLISATHLT